MENNGFGVQRQDERCSLPALRKHQTQHRSIGAFSILSLEKRRPRRRQHSISFTSTPLGSFLKLSSSYAPVLDHIGDTTAAVVLSVTESISATTASLKPLALLPFPVLDMEIYSQPTHYYELRGIGGGEQGGG